MGKAISRLFAKEGAKVAVTDLAGSGGETVAAELEKDGYEAMFCELDVTNREDAAQVVKAVVAKYGRIDILVNCAGIRGPKVLDVEAPPEQWDKVIAVTLTGVFNVNHKVLPVMMKQKSGVVVNIASVSSVVSTNLGMAYSAAKGGVLTMTKSMAHDYAPYGIRVNAVSPGLCNTEFVQKLLREAADPDALLAFYKGGNLLGRMAEPEDVANATLFLASEESAFITGTNLFVDGGFTSC